MNQNSTSIPRVVTVKEAAEILHIHPDTVMKFIDAGFLKAKQLPNDHWRINYRSVLVLIPTMSTETNRK